MSMKPRAIIGALVAVGIGFSAAGATIVRVRGNATMKVFGNRLAEWYEQKNPSVRFDVTAEYPANSFAAMADGKADIVQSSRKVLHAEVEALRSARGKEYVELQVATEVAGIAVETANPIRELSLYDLRQVLSGNVKNWKQVGGRDAPITIYGRDDTSGVREFLEDEFMGDLSISSSAKTFPTNARMWEALSNDPNGIGFGTVEMGVQAGARFLSVKPSATGEAVAPTGDAIRARRYKLTRPLYFYFAGVPTGDAAQFAEWVLTPEGQLVVESQGYYPLTSAEREEGMRLLTVK